GRPPFTGDEPWSVVNRVLHDRPVSPRVRVPGVPTDLELISLKCLEKEPEHRYPTAEALADDLRRVPRGEPAGARPPPAGGGGGRWVKRNPSPAALAVVAALLLFVGLPLAVVLVTRLGAARDVADAAERERGREQEAREAAERLARTTELFGVLSEVRKRSAD